MNEDKTTCPECAGLIDLAGLDFTPLRQDTYCPKDHKVFRIWNGPENPFYDENLPYGWSSWRQG